MTTLDFNAAVERRKARRVTLSPHPLMPVLEAALDQETRLAAVRQMEAEQAKAAITKYFAVLRANIGPTEAKLWLETVKG